MGLEVKNVTKTFGNNVAVDNLSFEMSSPGVFGLIGTNGAGKTTTIRVILGIMGQDSGEVYWNGKEVKWGTVNFGYLPEERGIYMKTTVLEQLLYFGMLRGMTKHAAADSALSYLDRFGISDYKNTVAEKLSKGNQQKIQLIAAIIHDPDLIFMDEPFAGLDPLNTDMLAELIYDLVKRGKYIIMSSHQMHVVEKFCDDILILHKGETLLKGNLREIKAGYGHTNLVVSANGDVAPIALAHKLELIEKRPDETEYKIHGVTEANAFLSDLIANGIYPTKYVIREPSLHEIFVEKVGKYAGRN
jgi:ABC-2 type transport system ATP-binding protein